MQDDRLKKAEELEQTLKMQLSLVKNESGDLVKTGATVLIGGLVTYTLFRLLKKKKRKKTDIVLKALEEQGLLDDEIKYRLTHKSSPGFMGRLSALVFPILLNYGKERFIQQMEQGKKAEE